MHDGRRQVMSPLPRVAMVATMAALAVWPRPAVQVQENAAAGSKWEFEIRAFEAADKTNPPPKGAILFVGSSSIRLWKTLAADFARHKVINRGFGGSQIEDSTALADRIIVPCRPKRVFLYAGDNDIAAGKSPERVCDDFKAFVVRVRAALPRVQIAFISIKPSPSRWHLVEKQKAANHLIERYCNSSGKVEYIDVFKPMLGADGKPRAELFLDDNLHLNAQGYQLWAALIRPHLK
jgi:lysophospholipase L1-like esterase